MIYLRWRNVQIVHWLLTVWRVWSSNYSFSWFTVGCGLTLLHTCCIGATFSHKAARGEGALSGSLDEGTNPIHRGTALVVWVLPQKIFFVMLFRGSVRQKLKSQSLQPPAPSIPFGTQDVNMSTSSGINGMIPGQLTPFWCRLGVFFLSRQDWETSFELRFFLR